MICWFVFVPAGVPVLVSLLLSSFFSQEKVFCFIMDFLVPLGSGWGSGLSPFFSLLSFLRKGVLFHHDLLVRLGSGWVPVLVSLLLSSFFPQERGSVPSWISWSWFLLLRAGVPVLVSLLLPFLFFYCLVFVRLK